MSLWFVSTFIADAFGPLLSERALADRYRLISYHHRGYGGSSRTGGPTSLSSSACPERLF
jgi:pimeloyl-ACP methyl ester carboxylesterase